MNDLMVIGPFSQILTMDNNPLKGPIKDPKLEILKKGWILTKGSKIISVGAHNMVIEKLKKGDKYKVHELKNDLVVLPGFIDSHTHLAWGGSRSSDYSMRLGGKSYKEISSQGGGIWSTVQKTRGLSLTQLCEIIIGRLDKLMLQGVTTAEVKSGYGLNVESETKQLEAIFEANNMHSMDLVSTCLAAHIKPPEFQNSSEYLKFLLGELLPDIWKSKICKRVDIFVEEGAFSPTEAINYLKKSKEIGFDTTVHADQFSTGGTEVAIKSNAMSADHLEASKEKEILMLSKSDVIPVVLPGSSMGLGLPFAPARKLLDAGASLAISSDWNPGSAPMGSLLLQAAVLGMSEKLTNAETFAAITYRAAMALNLIDRGKIVNGYLADLVGFPTNDYRDILYHQGSMNPTFMCKKGEILYE